MHSRHIHKPAARICNSCLCSRISPEEKESCIFFSRIHCLFFLCINVIKNLVSRRCLVMQIVCDLHRPVRIHIIVPDQDISHVLQFQIVTDGPVNREDQPSVISKHRIVYHIHNLCHQCICRAVVRSIRIRII